MATVTESLKFKHDNDCEYSGCPGHTMVVSHQTTSDSFEARVDGEIIYSGDDNKTRALLKLIKEVDYND